jgi:hypothetical protein
MKIWNFYKLNLALASKNKISQIYALDSRSVLNNNSLFYEKNINLFHQWLSGFIDGEGNFQINPLKGKNGKIIKFSFMFNINLHIDDLDTLNFIAKILGIGYVTIPDAAHLKKKVCSYRINKQSELFKLIQILKASPLNGVKQFDFEDFTKAYNLYFNRSNITVTDDLIDEVLKIKIGMNKQRTNFNRPMEINITDYWLLGLIEGEGSFHLIRSRLVPVFAIKMVSDQEPLMEAIKRYLTDRLAFDEHSLFKLNNSELISINYVPPKGNSKPQVFIGIENVRILYNYLLPFFKGLPFLTKKFKDFNDLILICYIIYHKIYKDDTIKDLVLKLSNNMNNFRLSSYIVEKDIITTSEIKMLLNADPMTIPLSDGRLLNLITQKLDSSIKGGSVFEIVNSDSGEVILANSLEDCASIIGISRYVLWKIFSSSTDSPFVSEIIADKYNIKRIGVFLCPEGEPVQ